MVHTRPHKYFVTRGRRYAKGDMKMRKRGIAAALAAVLLSLTLCGCWQEKWYSEDAYEQNYEDGFCAGVAAANKADAAYLWYGTGADIEYATEVLDSYLAGEGIYTRAEAGEAVDAVRSYYDEVLQVYEDIEDDRVDVDRPN